jgi:hypothetical protein
MYEVTPQFLEAIRYPHKAYGYVEAYYGGTLLTFPNEQGRSSTRLPLRTDGTNEVQVDSSTPGVRRTLTLTLAPIPGLWELLAPVGTEVRAYTVLEYLHGAQEIVPQGVFDIDVQRIGYAANGDLKLTAPDRWGRIQAARFLTPRASSAVSNRVQISSLITEALAPGFVVTDTSTSTAQVPSQTWDRDRDKAITDLAKAAALDVYFDRTGTPHIRDIPTLASGSVWTVDASASGVLIDASRERSRQKTFNIVVVSSPANPDGDDLFAPVYVWDNNPDSPTFAGTGPGWSVTPPDLSTAGPFGQRPTFYSSPLITTQTQAIAAGQAILEQTTGLNAQLSLTASPNYALDDGDTISVQLPQERYDLPRPVERHIVDKFNVPLVPTRSPQQLSTRSTVADINESGA